MSSIDLSQPNLKIAITGATSGIGLELTQHLCDLLCGAQLFLAGRDFSKVEKLSFSSDPILCKADLSKPEGIAHLCTEMDKFCPDVVLYCAGFTEYHFFSERSLESLDAEKSCMFDGAYHCLWSFVRQRNALRKEGTFLVISSVLAYLPSPAMAMYGASKAAISSLVASVDAEQKSKGVRVLSCCPGPVLTAFQKRASHGVYEKHDFWAIPASQVASTVLNQIKTQKATSHPGLLGRFGYYAGKLLPWSWLTKALIKRVENRIAR